ncbi:VOC family protein [Pseudoalteromonas piscicida]|uniref:Glyoxalase n=1 Tax=Pseudoalteromonas piscicida TaxID=43662 RepID=A0A2A5JQI3_PSEO7|nr:VOC family protein [Pseudoalteromonas piscicida]PCK31734.1 glyoxalase [Pseudoalteromonas piscicida]
MATSAIPDGYHSITPYLIVSGAAKAIEFYRQAFGAHPKLQLPMPEGGIAHAELLIGNSYIMISDMCPDMHFKDPRELGGTPVSLMLYVEDVDSVFAAAIQLGAEEITPVCDQFYGDRAGTLRDPFGHVWTLATHQEELTEEQLLARMADFMDKQQDA